jgi:hypothetical protein
VKAGLNGVELWAADGVAVEEEGDLRLLTAAAAEILIFDMTNGRCP